MIYKYFVLVIFLLFMNLLFLWNILPFKYLLFSFDNENEGWNGY